MAFSPLGRTSAEQRGAAIFTSSKYPTIIGSLNRTSTRIFLSGLFGSYLFSMQIYWSILRHNCRKAKFIAHPGYQGEMAWGSRMGIPLGLFRIFSKRRYSQLKVHHRRQFCLRCRWYRWRTLTCEYLREFFEKNWDGPNRMLWGWGETDSWKKPEAKNLVTLSLSNAYFSCNLYFSDKETVWT